MADTPKLKVGVRGPDRRNTVVKFPDHRAALEALMPGDVVVVSSDNGRTWQDLCRDWGEHGPGFGSAAIVICGKVLGHEGDHATFSGSVLWPQEALVRSFTEEKADG